MARTRSLSLDQQVTPRGATASHAHSPLAATRRVPAAPDERAVPEAAAVGAALVSSGAPCLDRLIHERLRLGIVSALAVNESLSFNDLKHLLGTTDGNLSVHARKLEEADYITCTKYFQGRFPKTEYRLTAAGRTALETYLDYMESLIRATRGPSAD
ncbi:MAG: winged helix-turn-helix domain-containing protein [Chloroflexota bacterium]